MWRLLILCFVSFSALSSFGCQNTQQSAASTIQPRANAESPRTLGSFNSIEGTTYLMAPIGSESKGEYFKEGNYDHAHNYVFLNISDESTHQLLPTNDYMITNTIRFPEERQSQKEPVALQWFLYFLVKDDTDGDKKLAYKDHRTLAISDSGGWGYAEIIQNVEQIYGQTLRDTNTLLIVYRSGAKKYIARVDLLNRKVVSTNEVASLGSDVQ